ncbi:ABC transporter ATP-binding protein [Marinobacteraceae bacterium S3BR75-40.1]|jgi:putative ABC transport system ATP-binding protein
MSIVNVEKASRVYRQDSIAVKALDEVSVTIDAGEFTTLVGPSGSGKTTLLNQIGALDEPDSGRIQVAGKEITGLSRKKRTLLRLWKIGFVFQEYNLIGVLSAQENVEYVLMLRGVPFRERRAEAQRILVEVGLQGLERRLPHELSGGQQQRVAVARAIVSKPAIVLADEPTANLDSKTGGALLDLMRGLNAEHGITFVFSTHDPMVMERARRVIHLRDGRVEREEIRP